MEKKVVRVATEADVKTLAENNNCLDFSSKNKGVTVVFESTGEANEFMRDLETSYLMKDGVVSIEDAYQPNQHESESHILILISDSVNEAVKRVKRNSEVLIEDEADEDEDEEKEQNQL